MGTYTSLHCDLSQYLDKYSESSYHLPLYGDADPTDQPLGGVGGVGVFRVWRGCKCHCGLDEMSALSLFPVLL